MDLVDVVQPGMWHVWLRGRFVYHDQVVLMMQSQLHGGSASWTRQQ